VHLGKAHNGFILDPVSEKAKLGIDKNLAKSDEEA